MKKFLKKIIPKIILKKYRELFIYKVYCSVCQSKSRRFGPFGVIKRENARCHNCGSLERHRLLWKYLEDKTDLFSSSKTVKLLHFAPELFFYKKFSSIGKIKYYPCDLNPKLYKFSSGPEVKKIDITNIGLEENSVDIILCNHVLEHIPDDKKAMEQLFSILKPGGWAILQVPIDLKRHTTYEDFSINTPIEREKAFGQHDHVRWYGLDYKERLASAGFQVKVDNFVNTFSKKKSREMGFSTSEQIYWVTKT